MKSRLERVQDWERLARKCDFQVHRLSAECGVSLRQLERFFKRRFRTTPHRWLRELQCHLAKERIALGYSTKAAAEELGFSSPSRFCHTFKRIHGVPPQQFSPMPTKMSPGGNNVANGQSLGVES